MDKIFMEILNMSLTASYVIVIIIAARWCLKKVPKIFSYALWLVVLFRLVSPFSFESVFSLIFVKRQNIPQETIFAPASTVSGMDTVAPMVNNSLAAPVTGPGGDPLQIWLASGELLWLLGMAVLVAYSIITAVRLSQKLKSARPVADNIYEMDNMKTPFVFGIIRPRIYLPTGLTEKERAYIIEHEKTHLKRFDHIIKPVAFLVLCIHWFNPLVWIAFFLMSEDMELSCDESVLKKLGSGIKKDYSSSLLGLSVGRRIIGGCPLAFGESNLKGRIKNILNYKKPAFWVVIVAVVAVITICLGLMSNPQQQPATVEDYAQQFVEEESRNYQGVKIVDSNITKLEKIAAFDKIYTYPIEMWRLEYRLRPDDPSRVMLAGGGNMVDGWITEDSSMGKPLLIFSYRNSQPRYLGCIRNGEADLGTLVGRETALRIFLEEKLLLPRETYIGNHVVIQFPLSTGETCQLLLSQPIVQGDRGIWCVERWMDGNGTVYHATPQTKLATADYYQKLQRQAESGSQKALLDPLQVAISYIKNDLGQYQVSRDQLVAQYGATVEDFAHTPVSHFIGYISEFNPQNSLFHLDKIEWLTEKDVKRLKELKIDPQKLDNGYYIYNKDTYPLTFEVGEKTQYYLLDWGKEITHKAVTQKEFISYLEQHKGSLPPFHVTTKDGYVQQIREQYLP